MWGGGDERKARALEGDMSLSDPQLSDCTEYWYLLNFNSTSSLLKFIINKLLMLKFAVISQTNLASCLNKCHLKAVKSQQVVISYSVCPFYF
jgi:hypothetical protein